MLILKRTFILVSLFSALFVFISPNLKAVSNSVPSPLHNKSELNTAQLYNISDFYKSTKWHIDAQKKRMQINC